MVSLLLQEMRQQNQAGEILDQENWDRKMRRIDDQDIAKSHGLKITVTRKDIDNGISCNGFFCPIALAFKRAAGEKVFIDDTTYDMLGKKKTYGLKLPKPAQRFIRAFDAGRKVEPFEFEVGE